MACAECLGGKVQVKVWGLVDLKLLSLPTAELFYGALIGRSVNQDQDESVETQIDQDGNRD